VRRACGNLCWGLCPVLDDIDKDHLLLGDEPVPIGRQYYKSFIEQLNVIE